MNKSHPYNAPESVVSQSDNHREPQHSFVIFSATLLSFVILFSYSAEVVSGGASRNVTAEELIQRGLLTYGHALIRFLIVAVVAFGIGYLSSLAFNSKPKFKKIFYRYLSSSLIVIFSIVIIAVSLR